MSDSDRWWVIAILAAFVIGGVLWLLWSRSRRPAPSDDSQEWRDDTAAGGINFADEAPRVFASGSEPVSTADVTLSRHPDGVDTAAAVEARQPLADVATVASVEETELAETLAAGGLDESAGLTGEAESPLASASADVPSTVGSEISDTAWRDRTATDAGAARPDTGDVTPAAEAGGAAVSAAAPEADLPAASGMSEPPADMSVAAAGADAESAASDADLGHADSGAPASASVAAFAAMPAAGASAEIGSVVVSEVHHGADGHDHGAGEWVVLTNGSGDAIDLAGWRLTDEGAKHEYTFPAHTLAPGGSVRVYMARGEAVGSDLYCGQNVRWWNNEGDCAYLYDASGKLVHVHCYGNATASA